MEKAGFPPDIAQQMIHHLHHLKRYLKIGGTYDAIYTACNGTPQGCSLSLIIANLYVTTIFNLLTDNTKA